MRPNKTIIPYAAAEAGLHCIDQAIQTHGGNGFADEYGLTVWVTYGLIELGWAVAELGNPHKGIEMMERGLAKRTLGRKQ